MDETQTQRPAQTTPAPEPKASALEARGWVLAALVGGVTFLLYAPTLRFGFVYDDRMQILENPFIQSWHWLPKLFTSNVWEYAGPTFPANYWRPLFMVWLLINHTLSGFNPAGWHLTTVTCHAAAAVLVYKLAERLTGDRVMAAVAGLLFGVHPATIETAAWVSGVTDSLLAVFFISALLLYLGVRESGGRARLGGSLAVYAMALLAKETAIVLPLVILKHAWIYYGDPARRPRWGERLRAAFLAALPYLAVSGLYLVARLQVLKVFAQTQNHAGLAAMLATWPSLLLLYLRLLVYPAGISPHYDQGMVLGFSFSQVVLPALALIAVAVGLWGWSRRSASEEGRMVAFAATLMVIPVLPVLYLRPLPEGDFAHARYLYLPMIGFAMLAALGLRKLGRPAASMVAALAVVAALAISTGAQQMHWASSLLLYSRGATVAPQNPAALINLGTELAARQHPEEAITVLQRALKLKPDSWHANYNLGYTYMLLHRYAEAEPRLQSAARLQPYGADQFAYLGIAQMELGKLPEAESNLRQAIARAPAGHHFHYALGLILEKQGRKAEALAEFQAELKVDPNDAEAKAAVVRSQESGVSER